MYFNAPITIRPATANDLHAIMRLEGSSNTAAHWSEQQYKSLVANNESAISRLALVAEAHEDPEILGFLIAHQIGPEWELENIVVSSEMQKKGIGTLLLNALLTHVKQANNQAVFLEVRESNKAARGIYEKLGFQQTGRRKSYYSNPLEDAILYQHMLPIPDHS